MSSRFLYSFARRNELFATLNDTHAAAGLTRVPDRQMQLTGDPKNWAGQTPIALDPAGDSVMRAFQSSGDIVRLYACRDSHMLYTRLDASHALSPQVAYRLTLRPIGRGLSQPAALAFTVMPGAPGRKLPLPGVPGGFYAWRGTLLEASIPLKAAGLARSQIGETLYLMGQTRFADMEIDRTGFRAVACDPASPTPTVTASR